MKTLTNTPTNCYSYAIMNGKISGSFNIYQAVNGKIMITMGNRFTSLTLEQINDLNIDVYSLIDFDIEMYEKAYTHTSAHY